MKKSQSGSCERGRERTRGTVREEREGGCRHLSVGTGLHEHVSELQQEVVSPPLWRLRAWRGVLSADDVPIGPPLVLLQDILLTIASPLQVDIFIDRAALHRQLVGPSVGKVFVDKGTEERHLILANRDYDTTPHVIEGVLESVESRVASEGLVDREVQPRLDGSFDGS
jgi:hypothetical protein